ncbi:MAG: BolA family transcriptional regulator [Candidatus Omnitrophica bacterium]|nr:BolA family transcriptional regulator [Candidatus Omnitrophota bacterium]
MITSHEIKDLVRRAVPDAQVEVEDLTGGGDHFQILVVSKMFQGKLLIDQHRLVQNALEPAMADGRIHAVQIKTRIPTSTKKTQDDGLNIIG